MAAATQTAVQTKTATTNTGVPTVSNGNSSTLRDFLSFFTAAIENGNVTSSGSALTLDWTVPFDFIGDGSDKLKMQAVITDPVLSSQVTTALASNPAAVTSLSESLDATDDIAVSASYAPEGQRLGRSLGPHVTLLDALVYAATNTEGAHLQAMAKFGGSLQGQVTTTGGPIAVDTPFSDYPPGLSATVVGTVQQFAIDERALASTIQEITTAFTSLLNNQPQAYASGIYHARGELVGPNVWSGKFTYEMGGRNLNKFLRQNPDCDLAKMKAELSSPDSMPVSSACLTKLLAFAKPLTTGNVANASSRLAISAEYDATQRNDISIPADSLSLTNPASHSFVYTVAYGLPLATTVPNREGRIDVSLNYENVSDDPTKNDRFVGSITYTQKLTDTVTLPISLVYANHGVYLPEVDRKLNVHFGLSYKIPSSNP